MELAYAGLHQLCAPMLELRGRLPDPQRDAVETAFGLNAKPPPDRFVVGLAVLGLLSESADEQPLVCVVDDAQWLDNASTVTIAFVARRLMAESVGLVFAVREPSEARQLDGLPELPLEGLDESDARALLESAWPGRLDKQVRNRVIAESHGNPLALLELPRVLTPARLAGGFELPDAAPLTSRIEQSFLRQLEPLPTETRRLLLTAAAEPVGDMALLWRAADRLGLDADAAGPAQMAGLIDLGALCGSVTPWCARRCTRRRPWSTARRCIARWPRRPIPRRPRSPRMAQRARGFGIRRGRCRRTGALRRARTGSRRHRRSGRVPRASG